jgi:hypothetical protein
MSSITTAGRVRTTFALHPATYEWLKNQAQGQRALSEIIDLIVQKERLLSPLDWRLQAIEKALATLARKGDSGNK